MGSEAGRWLSSVCCSNNALASDRITGWQASWPAPVPQVLTDCIVDEPKLPMLEYFVPEDAHDVVLVRLWQKVVRQRLGR
jgi:hypothetical protein